MNTNFLKITLGLALTACGLSASAQKTYTQGVATYSVTTARGAAESKTSFTADSTSVFVNQGMFTTTMISNNKGTFLAILVDVPVMSTKKAAVFTPDELDQMLSSLPKFEFTAGTETKVINGFNCKKFTAKDSKSGATYETWVTNDIKMPESAFSKTYAATGGVPVQFTSIQMGQPVKMELKSIVDTAPAAGTFGIPKGYERISLEDLQSMGGKR